MAKEWHRLVPGWMRRAFQSIAAPDQSHPASNPTPASREEIDRSTLLEQELPGQPPSPAASSIVVNLGIDFGTAFTKICYRDSALEESGIVTFGARATSDAMIPSVVSVTEGGDLVIGEVESSCERIEYLKMRLAKLRVPVTPPECEGIDLSSNDTISALSSWYLASVIRRSQEWITEHDAERLVGRRVIWTANVGVPVEHCDSPALAVFERVLAVAWAWASGSSALPSSVQELLDRYAQTARLTQDNATDLHAVPEIAAAARSYLTSRDATPDIYLYFDIGAGTVDGVAFRYVIMDGTRRVNFYSGKVAPLGVAVVGLDAENGDSGSVENALVAHKLPPSLRNTLAPYGKEVQKVVGHVVMTAKRKDLPSWQSLTVFLGGGGAGVKWYRDTIEATHENYRQIMAGIPEYRLREVPKPGGLRMNGLKDSAFRRFAIAYGLSVPFAEGPDIGLPSEFSDVASPRVKREDSIVDYQDSKDVYD